MIEFILEFDKELFYLINHSRYSFFDLILPLFSKESFHYFFFILFLGILSVLSYYKNQLRRILLIVFLLVIGYPVTDFCCGKVLKKLIPRERPFAELANVYYYVGDKFKFQEEPVSPKNTRSFPSCHSANVGYAVFFLSLNYRFAIPLLFPFLFFVGYSRIYLGHHYPLDVLGGIILGLIWSIIFYKFTKKLSEKVFKNEWECKI